MHRPFFASTLRKHSIHGVLRVWRLLGAHVLVLALFFTSGAIVPSFAADPAAVVKEGDALEKAKKNDEALQLYRTALKAGPSEEVYRKAASLLGKLQKYDDAAALLKEGIGHFPKSAHLLNLLGLIKFRKGDKDEDVADWKKALELDLVNAFTKEWLAKAGAVPSKTGTPSATSAVVDGDKPVEAGNPTKSGTSSTTGGTETGVKTSSGDGYAAVTPALPAEEQEKLGKKLFTDMTQFEESNLDGFIQLHREVITKCPDTKWAQESCWKMSNLFLMGYGEPKYPELIEVLEHLITKYPDCILVPDAKNRLVTAYRADGQHQKIVTIYEDVFKNNPQLDEKTFMVYALEYGDALRGVGREADAKVMFQQVIDKDNNRDQLEARVAKDRLGLAGDASDPEGQK